MADSNDILYYNNDEANRPSDVDRDGTIASPISVMSGFIFQDAITREPLTGTMPENSAVYITLEPSTTDHLSFYVIPEGHHAGNGMVIAPNISEYTFGTATAEDVATGKVAWVNGERIVGTLDVRANAQEGNATATDILNGKTAWVNGERIVGTIPYLYRVDKTLLPGESYNIPYGLSSGESIVTAANISDLTPGTATAEDIAFGKTVWVNGEEITGTYKTEDAIREWLSEADVPMGYVLEGNKFYSTLYPNNVVEGTMVDHSGEETRTLTNGDEYFIPAGYYDGLVSIKVTAMENVTVANMEPDDLIAGKTAWVNGEKVTGTMPYIGIVNETIACSEEYIIPKGFHSGEGKVVAKDLASQTIADAENKNILNGKTAWVNGEKITGTMVRNSSESILIAAGEHYMIPQGYHTGSGNVYSKSIADQTAGTATPDTMLEGYTAWVNGVEITGIIPTISNMDINLDGSEVYTIPEGYHDGTSTVTATGISDQTPGTATADDILNGKTAWVNGTRLTGNIELTGNAISVQVLKGKTFYNTNVHQQITGELELTGNAEPDKVLKGYKFYSDDPFTQQEGTLELTGNARSAFVLDGYTFYTTQPDYKETGSMVNRGAIIKGLTSGEVYTIPAGYHNGSGKVTAPSIESITSGTAIASDILSEKTAWVDGIKLTGTLSLTGDAVSDNVLVGKTFYSNDAKNKLTGSMQSYADSDITLQSEEEFIINQGYHTGAIIKAADLSGQTDGTATSSDILDTKTAWVNGEKVTGTIPIMESEYTTILAGETYDIPRGYHDGYGHIISEGLDVQTPGSSSSSDILIYKTAWVNGIQLTGSMPDNGSESDTILAGQTHIISAGYHDGTGEIIAESLDVQTPGSATAADILDTKTAWVNGERITGTIEINNTNSINLDAGETRTFTAAYFSNGISISATSLASQTPGSATATDILNTKIAWVNGIQLTGTMPDNGAVSSTLNCGSNYIIPAGYHNGSGIITAATLASQTHANSTDADILNGKTAWVEGEKIIGTMPDNGAVDIIVNADEVYTIPAGYHNGSGTVTGANMGGQTPGTATVDDILNGKTAWVNGTRLTGNIPIQSGTNTTLLAGETIVIPAGYYPTSFSVYAASLASQTDGTATAEDIVIDETAWVKGNKITGIIPDGDANNY